MSIGVLNADEMKYSADLKNCIIHAYDAMCRGYISPLEMIDAANAVFKDGRHFPEYLRIRESAYKHLV
jgi:hypothetical protein